MFSEQLKIHPPNLTKEGSVGLSGWMPELDGLRSLALLLVILTHWFGPIHVNWDHVAFLPLFIAQYGWVGVNLFFVLSGFLITGILLDSKDKKHYFRNFYIRRALRIIPLFYVVLIIFMFLIPDGISSQLWASTERPWWYFAFLSNIAEGLGLARHRFFVISWSLSVEEHFYLFWPLVVMQYNRPTLKRICIAVVLFSFLMRVTLIHLVGSNLTLIGYLTPCRLEGLVLGSLVAVMAREGKASVDLLFSLSRRYLPILFVALVFFNVLQELQILYGIYNSGSGQHPYVVSFGIFFMDLFFAAFMVFVLFSAGRGVLSHLFRWAPMVWFGKLTYCGYLLHEPVRYFVRMVYHQLIGQGTGIWSYWIPLNIINFIVLLIVCWISWTCFEGPILGLKKYFSSKQVSSTEDNKNQDVNRNINEQSDPVTS